MRRTIVALALAIGGCGSPAPTARPESCAATTVWAIDEAQGCWRGPLDVSALQSCFFPDEAQGHGIFEACAVGSDGGLYLSDGSSTTHFESDAGWRFSQLDARFTPTLSADDQARCNAAAPLFPVFNSSPRCDGGG